MLVHLTYKHQTRSASATLSRTSTMWIASTPWCVPGQIARRRRHVEMREWRLQSMQNLGT